MLIRCNKCGKEKPIDDFRCDHNFRPHKKCADCENEYNKARRIERGVVPMERSKTCSLYLGVHIAETVLENEFRNIQRMPFGNPGYDYICSKGYKIDVKSACGKVISLKDDFLSWSFTIKRNMVADYFLCLAFGSRQSLNPKHLWLVPGELVRSKQKLLIRGDAAGLNKWSPYERPIDNVLHQCDLMRSNE